MKGKIVAINLLILFVYTMLINAYMLNEGDHYASIGAALSLMYAIGFHALINFGLSIGYFIKKRKDLGKSFLLSTAVVLVVGFSSCYGSLVLHT